MKKTILLIVLSLGLGGCFGATGLDAQWETAVACQTYGSTLRGLTAVVSQLKPEQIQAVTRAKNVAHPICTGKKPGNNPEATLKLLQGALNELARVKTEVAK